MSPSTRANSQKRTTSRQNYSAGYASTQPQIISGSVCSNQDARNHQSPRSPRFFHMCTLLMSQKLPLFQNVETRRYRQARRRKLDPIKLTSKGPNQYRKCRIHCVQPSLNPFGDMKTYILQISFASQWRHRPISLWPI